MKKNCIFVTGPESSGSTLIAKVINEALCNQSWNGRGFNCCDDPRCDIENGYMAPCQPKESLVCHRSLPFDDSWPPIAEWNKFYTPKYVICTRDSNVCRVSQLSRFKWKDDETLANEKKKAVGILNELIYDKDIPTFIWSYETYILLDKVYLHLLADFLEIPRHCFDKITPPLNGNLKYISNSTSNKNSFISKMFRK